MIMKKRKFSVLGMVLCMILMFVCEMLHGGGLHGKIDGHK